MTSAHFICLWNYLVYSCSHLESSRCRSRTVEHLMGLIHNIIGGYRDNSIQSNLARTSIN
uniref:SJCHGC03114 protein n=1 Tax=Schistosoma japonicum TaxID=6182 RepID=Q5BSW7_SCHJA|nr:SJCHGC03114 protein [Schistosoma japonicum]